LVLGALLVLRALLVLGALLVRSAHARGFPIRVSSPTSDPHSSVQSSSSATASSR